MRVVAISCVKNEGDIIEAFVRHVAAFVDQLVVLDNGSTDETAGILCSLKYEGIPLEIVEDPSLGHWHWKRMTHLMKDYAIKEYGADWIIPLDADELIVAQDPITFRAALENHSQPLKIRWKTYVPDSSDDIYESNPVLRIRHRLVEEDKIWKKIVVPGNILRSHDNVTISQGNHNLFVNGKKCKCLDWDSVHLAHIPIRGPEQYGSKIAIGHLQMLSLSEKEKDWCWHWKLAYELLKTDIDCFTDTFREAALHYAVRPESNFSPKTVFDPIPYFGGSLKYTKMNHDRWKIFLTVINYAESLAKSYSDLALEHGEALEKIGKLEKLTRKFRFLTRFMT